MRYKEVDERSSHSVSLSQRDNLSILGEEKSEASISNSPTMSEKQD